MARALMSTGILILLLYLQKTLAQQCSNNVGYKNSPGLPQQNYQKPSSGQNQITQNGNFNSPSQGNMQQMNYQQQSNIQQAFAQQASNQPLLDLRQGNSLPANTISNSQLLNQPNQELAANIISTLYNIQQPPPNQRGTRNIVQGNSPQRANYDPKSPSQSQPNLAFTVTGPLSKSQNNQPSISNSYPDYPQFQPAFTFHAVPSNNAPAQQNQQLFALPVHKASTNDQNPRFSIQNQPVLNTGTRQQATAMQSPMVMNPGTQGNTAQNRPIVLTFHPAQVQNQPNQPTIQTSQSQPIMYAVQTQPSSESNKYYQPEIPNQQLSMNPPMDKQSLMSYVMSQMQNPQGNGDMLASLLPAMVNKKSDKSSSMKALLPLIINILNERNSCGCPDCGCNKSNNVDYNRPEPVINTGYSNQINYSPQKPAEVLAKMTEYTENTVDSTKTDAKQRNSEVEITNSRAESYEEDEEGSNDSEEEYDE